MNPIGERLDQIRERMSRATRESGRAADQVKLVAVSKGHPAESIDAAYQAGQRDFGENYVQELKEKWEALGDRDGLVFHAIGSLQRNKVKDVVKAARIIHTVDRLELAEEIDKRAPEPVSVLLEVNVAHEAQKAGISPEEALRLADQLRPLVRLQLIGLMTIPPADASIAENRGVFAALRELAEQLRREGHSEVRELSMGMSHDFESAILEGATIIRVGTAIFGERAKKA